MGTTGTAATAPRSRPTVEALLGGRAVLRAKPRSALDWVELVRRGVPAGAVDSLTASLHVTQADLARTLGISERTLVRRKKEGTFNSEESAKLVRLARVVERAIEVFEHFDLSLDWLQSPNTSMGGATPFSLLDTDIGAESVLDTLGRIEHGVFG